MKNIIHHMLTLGENINKLYSEKLALSPMHTCDVTLTQRKRDGIRKIWRRRALRIINAHNVRLRAKLPEMVRYLQTSNSQVCKLNFTGFC